MKLDTYEVFILSAFLLSAFAKFIPIRKKWGNPTEQGWEIIISFFLFFGYIVARSYWEVDYANILFGILLSVFFLSLNFISIWRFAKSPAKQTMDLFSPLVNFIVTIVNIFISVLIINNPI